MARQLPAGKCIQHAINSVRNNISYAFRISWPWYVVLIALSVGAGFLAEYVTGGNPETNPGPVVPIYIVLAVVNLLAFSSIAVNWHRYILLDEVPHSGEIFRLDDKTWRYFGNILLIFVIMMAVAALIMLPLFALASLSESLGLAFIAAVIGFILSGVLFLRLSVKLPSIALGRRDFLMRDSWKATQGNNVPLLLVILCQFAIVIVALLFLLLVQFILFSVSQMLAVIVSTILQLAVNWIFSIFSVTILTSLYGFFVENRDF